MNANGPPIVPTDLDIFGKKWILRNFGYKYAVKWFPLLFAIADSNIDNILLT